MGDSFQNLKLAENRRSTEGDFKCLGRGEVLRNIHQDEKSCKAHHLVLLRPRQPSRRGSKPQLLKQPGVHAWVNKLTHERKSDAETAAVALN